MMDLHEYTLELLDLLEEHEIPAIFFVIGENIDMYLMQKTV